MTAAGGARSALPGGLFRAAPPIVSPRRQYSVLPAPGGATEHPTGTRTTMSDNRPDKRRFNCHVISNTHWDREWRYPFQSYRMDLVVMMDRLLDVLEHRPDYRSFFLDSQTVLLDDYLEIRPENEVRIRALVREDRLQVGPWYTLPDMWGCPGEALVRNLLMGHKGARRFGRVTKVGYTPFSNGQISQVPQLYQGFGLDSIMFYRGIGKHVAKSEFIWEGPDGSRVFGFRFGDYARYNYYYLLYRPGLLGRTIRDREYVWNPEEVPWRVATPQSQDRQYGYIDQRLAVRDDLLASSLDDAHNFTAADATTSELLYMMGHDHSFAAGEEADLVEALRAAEGRDGDNIVFSSLTDYMEAFRREAEHTDLQVLHGEMRHTLKEGLWTTLMARILSCRLYLKQENARVNAKILTGAEPLAAAAWARGAEYPARFLEIAWQKLLVNQAHDAIGGCSVDKVHREMQARWSEVDTIADEICRRSMRDVAARVDGSGIAPADLQLTVFNTLPFARGGVAAFVVDLPHAKPGEEFALEDVDGTAVPLQVVARAPYDPTIEGGYDLNMPFEVERCDVRAELHPLPGLGYRALRVRRGAKPDTRGTDILRGPRALENARLRVDVNANGTLRLEDKATGRVMDNLCWFEDTAEFGDPWSRKTPDGDTPVTSLAASATVEALHGGPLEAALRVSLAFDIPAGKTADGRRSPETVTLPATLTVTLRKDAPLAEVTVQLTNHARNHRLRLMMPSGLPAAARSYAEGQFDVLERDIALFDATGWKEAPYPTHPMWNFCGTSDGTHGLAVLNDGLTEYEVVDDAERTIAVTLMRTFGTFVFGRPTPDSQCLGDHTYRFALLPHTGGWADSDVVRLTREFITPLQAVESAPTRGTLAPEHTFLAVDNQALAFGAVKQAENGKGLVVRLWNPLDTPAKFRLTVGTGATKARLLTLEEKPAGRATVKDGAVRLTAGPKQIVSVWLG